MKTRLAIFLLLGGMVAQASWVVLHAPKSDRPNPVSEARGDTLEKGLEYLVKHQHDDGHWEADDGKHPVAMTALVGLAVLMDCGPQLEPVAVAGGPVRRPEYKNEGKYADKVRKAVDWLLSHSQPSGLIFSGHPSETARYMLGHGLATMFLAGATPLVDNGNPNPGYSARLRVALTRAVDYIARSQSSRGGWYHTSRLEGHDLDDVLATFIQVRALETAQYALIPFRSEVLWDGHDYLRNAWSKAAPNRPGQAAEISIALACHFHLLPDKRSGKWPNEQAKRLQHARANIPVSAGGWAGSNPLAHYYFAQALAKSPNEDDNPWHDYHAQLLERLQENQSKDGSWPVLAAHQDSLSVGRLYVTTLWCTILQFDKRVLALTTIYAPP